jgi:hypothetical protein
MTTALLEEETTEVFEEQVTATVSSSLGFFVKDIERLAQHYIERFFIDKLLLSGEPVPLESMSKEYYIDKVLNLDVCGGIDLIYGAIGVKYSVEETRACERKGQLPADVKHVLSLYKQCATLGIPKCFATGIIIIYLELCKGYHIV